MGNLEDWSLERYRKQGGGGACRLALRVVTPPWSEVPPLAFGGIEIALAAMPGRAVVERLERDLGIAIDRLLTDEARRQGAAGRRLPPMGEFHYVCRPDGTVEDRSGPADGTSLAALAALVASNVTDAESVSDAEGVADAERAIEATSAAPMAAVLELATALAAIHACAEEDGAIHPGIAAGDVRVDERGAVSLEGFGRRPSRRTPPAPETPRELNTFGLERQPDWVAIARHGLGALLREGVALVGGGGDGRRSPRDEQPIVDALPAEVSTLLDQLGALEPTARPSALTAWRTLRAQARGRARLVA